MEKPRKKAISEIYKLYYFRFHALRGAMRSLLVSFGFAFVAVTRLYYVQHLAFLSLLLPLLLFFLVNKFDRDNDKRREDDGDGNDDDKLKREGERKRVRNFGNKWMRGSFVSFGKKFFLQFLSAGKSLRNVTHNWHTVCGWTLIIYIWNHPTSVHLKLRTIFPEEELIKNFFRVFRLACPR